MCCLNTHSVKTKTWLRSDIDAVCISEMVPTGYECYHVPRNTGRIGGGVGIMFKIGLSVTIISTSHTDTTVSHFE